MQSVPVCVFVGQCKLKDSTCIGVWLTLLLVVCFARGVLDSWWVGSRFAEIMPKCCPAGRRHLSNLAHGVRRPMFRHHFRHHPRGGTRFFDVSYVQTGSHIRYLPSEHFAHTECTDQCLDITFVINFGAALDRPSLVITYIIKSSTAPKMMTKVMSKHLSVPSVWAQCSGGG